MASIPCKNSLSKPRRWLIEQMQQLNFGRIEAILVRHREPMVGPDTRIIREIKLGGDNAPRPERTLDDFSLKAQVIELLHELDRLGDGSILTLEVKHGLPFRMLVAEAIA